MGMTLRAGEYLWSPQGQHVCDSNGFALVCMEDTVVEFDPSVEARAMSVIQADRTLKGLDPEGLPLPEPEPLIPEPTKIPTEA